MKLTILLSIAFCVFFIGSAFVVLIGKGDWMINNYRYLSDERKAKINIFRLRKVMAAMLFYIGAIMPLHIFVRNETQINVLAIVTIIVLVGLLLVARFWAGMPLLVNPFKK